MTPRPVKGDPALPSVEADKPADAQARRPRRLVLCLDGTANNPFMERKRVDGTRVVKPTNVLKLARAIKPVADNGIEQITYYDTGVGAMSRHPGATNRLLASSDKVFGGLGAGFEQNVEDALHFLILNHREGDEVFLFGFSRGAATAQAIANFLDWADGLPHKADAYWLPILFRAYIKDGGRTPCAELVEKINAEQEARKRDRLDFHGVNVRFLGVWDTVMALGSRFRARGKKTATRRWSFYMASKPARCVLKARHALAVDEVRYDFRPEIWEGCHLGQDMQQRWFAGVHSNVGGGYVNDGLANLALRWMVKEARGPDLKNPDLDFDDRALRFFSGYAFDSMYRSDNWLYRGFDAIRWRFGRGYRNFAAVPETANATLDPSVIHRISWSEAKKDEHPEMKRLYRPRNVIQHLAMQPDLDAYFAQLELSARRLPQDVQEQIAILRQKRARP